MTLRSSYTGRGLREPPSAVVLDGMPDAGSSRRVRRRSARSGVDTDGSFDDLVRRHSSAVLATARSVVRNGAAADDIAQAVFIKLWLLQDRYDPTLGSMDAWLRLVTRGIAIDWIRHETRLQARSRLAAPVAQRDFHEERTVTALCVREAIAALPANQRGAVSLAYITGLSYRAVAEALNISEGTAKSRIRLGLRRLAVTLGAYPYTSVRLAPVVGPVDGSPTGRASASVPEPEWAETG